MANHFETLIYQFYDWQGCVVKCNIRVARLEPGGYAGELDVVVYDPKVPEVIHYEPSLDGDSWAERERRYKKKFELGRMHIFKDVFPWVSSRTPIRQIAVFNNVPVNRKDFVGAEAKSIEDLVKEMKDKIGACGYVGENAIPEKYDLLRTIQLVICGYYTDPK
jgi:hypothetical protein